MMKEFTTGITTMFKEFFNKETNKKQRANMWTFSRLILAFYIPIMSLISKITISNIGYILAASLTLLGTISDFIDGKSARKHNSTSDFGKKLDMLSDKVFAFMLGISLSLINPLFIFNILGEALISSINIYYQHNYHNLVPKSSYLGKVKQWPLSISFILGYLSVFLPKLTFITNIFIFTSFIMELAVFKNYIYRNNCQIKEFKNTNNNQIKNNNKINTNKEKTLKNEYINLRNILIEIKKSKENNIEKENIKIKKRK